MKQHKHEYLACSLHLWYLEAVQELSPESYNEKAKVPYMQLSEEQKNIDRHIASRVQELIDEEKTNAHWLGIGYFALGVLVGYVVWSVWLV